MSALVAAAFVLLICLLWLGQRRVIYFPARDVPPPSRVGLARAEEVAIEADDPSPRHALRRGSRDVKPGIELGAWWVPAERASGVTVVVFNGNAGNRAYRAELASALAHRGLSVLLFDYRGYGGNSGSPTEEGLANDARAALAYATSRAEVDPNRVLYFGESLGAAVAVRLATERPPAGLILRSPFTSMADVGRHHYPFLPVRWLLRDRYASIDRIRDVKCPLLVIAAARDSIVPAEQSRELFDAANEPKRLVIIENADHNDYELLAGEGMIAAIMAFIRGT